jgi:hypothetical protein
MGAMGLGLGLAFGRKGGGNPPPPASVASPVQGTDLTAIWNKQYSGTGPRSAYSNGVWNGATPGTGGTTTGIPTYLVNKGFMWSNASSLYIDVTTTNVSVENYDFTGAPLIVVNGSTGSLTLTDCKMPALGINSPRNINHNPQASSTMTLTCSYCLFDVSVFYVDYGTQVFSYCTFSNQIQELGGASNTASVTIDNCYIPGGGCNPPANSHVEYIQYNANSPGVYTFSNNMCKLNGGGQASLSPTTPNYGWTGVNTAPVGTGTVAISNSIFIGLDEVNANPLNPGRIAYVYQYGQLTPSSITNCVMQIGNLGYSSNGDSGANRPTVSGNRTYTNAALNAGDFG